MLENYVVVDLEMTGVHPKKDVIIEIGAVKVLTENGNLRMKEFQSLVRPRKAISLEITEMTGITNEMVENAPSSDEVMPRFFDFLGEHTLIGHMIICDYSFLKQWAVNHERKFERNGIDTLKIARARLPELSSYKLDDLSEYYGMNREQNHRALDDARATNILYRSLASEFEDLYEIDFTPKKLRYTGKKQTGVTVQQIRYLTRLTKYHNLEMPPHVDEMTRSEASQLTDKIIHQYGKMPKEFLRELQGDAP